MRRKRERRRKNTSVKKSVVELDKRYSGRSNTPIGDGGGQARDGSAAEDSTRGGTGFSSQEAMGFRVKRSSKSGIDGVFGKRERESC
ncbi:hypothetical protein PanWU01x14_097750 [Parasponia andersonii]|uniref:Uncharacterized protein n=1 Tax=Parasponia andersonii TaxID=3476 RepID=A0A2P5D4N8_PARAD|nr:hypothetical protein PanWU01x14_097750 [Parasponia andersonii]